MRENRTRKQPNMRMGRLLLFALLLLLGTAAARPSLVAAGSATVGFLAESLSVEVDEVLLIYLAIDADTTLGDVECYISYDDEILEYKEGSVCIAGGGGVLKLSDMFASPTEGTRKYALKFVAKKAGDCEVAVMGRPVVSEYTTGLPMSVLSTHVTITVNAGAMASENALLSSLKISPGILTPEFAPELYEYNTIVDADTVRLYVSALPQDATAAVAVEGNAVLVGGDNTVLVRVTAESGAVVQYTIYCYRETGEPTPTEEAPSVTPTPEPTLPPEKGFEWRLAAHEQDGHVYLEGAYRFEVCELPEGLSIPEGYQKTRILVDGISITAYESSKQSAGDFLLLVLCKENGETGLYRYDRAEKTIQRMVEEPVTIVVEQEGDTQGLNEQLKTYRRQVKQLMLLSAGLGGFSVLLLIALVRLLLKGREQNRDDLD